MRRWDRRGRMMLAGAVIPIVLVALTVVLTTASSQSGERSAPTNLVTRTRGSGPPSSSATSVPIPASAASVEPGTVTTAPRVEVKGIVVERGADPQPVPAALDPCPGGGGSIIESILIAHRSVRCENALPDVALDGSMSEHSQFHAERLMQAGACANLFHSSELATWYASGYWGENAACMDWSGGCWGDASRVMTGWMASPEHRENILDPHYHRLGIGVACDGRHTYFVVQFAS